MRTTQIAVPGARLVTDIQLPDGDGPFPAVVLRTPYDRRRHRAEARGWAARGFAAVVQDVRGRYASGGQWHPYRDEAADGAATLRRIRDEAWSDGRIVAAGASYAAHCALAAARGDDPAGRPDAVIAAVPALGLAETAREAGGVERLSARAGWWAAHGDRPDSDEQALAKALASDPRLLEHLPPATLPSRLGRDLPSWGALWEAVFDAPDAAAPGLRVPLLVVGGSRDPFLGDAVRLWQHWSGTARLLLGPWGHGLTAEPGPEARPGHAIALGELYVRWARAALDGTLRPGRHGAIALGGSEHWYAADTPSRPSARDFGSPAGLRLLHGEHFTADPHRPVRSDELGIDTGVPADRAVLVTPPLPRPLDLLGSAGVQLRATADTPSADWAVRVVALDPDGRADPLAVGVVRRADPPGADARFPVPLGPLARRLPAGTRLRVEIAGHHFPAHARNPHTGEDPVHANRLTASRRTVRTTGSTLLLPVADGRRHPVDPVEETCT
ncbi:CocE/NonD family hydrolase [Streptomyces sp. NPDC002867]